MKDKVKLDISKEVYDQIQHVDFSDVIFTLRALRCEINLDDKSEKDHCAILDIKIQQKENKMNIDNLATQTQEEKEALDSIKPIHLRDYQKGANKEVEWKNGDECRYLDERGCVFIGMRMNSKTHCIVETKSSGTYMPVNVNEISKPESPEEKGKRERLEAAYDLYVTHENYIDNPVCSLSIFTESNEPKNKWLAIVDKTNYRKEK